MRSLQIFYAYLVELSEELRKGIHSYIFINIHIIINLFGDAMYNTSFEQTCNKSFFS